MSEHEFWNQDWMDVQRKYWDNWSELSRKAMGGAPAPKNPWEQSLEHWWQAVSPAAPSVAEGFMSKMMEQGKHFFQLAEQFTGGSGQQRGQGDWTEVFNRMSSELRNAFTGAGPVGADDAIHRMMGAWEMPFDNWQRMVSSLSLVPGDLLRNMPHGGPQAGLDRVLSAPGLGYTREEQGQQKEMLRLLMEYQRALQEYMLFFSNIGVLSVERMRQMVEGMAKEGRTIDSARSLYDDWVTCCEEVYGEQVMTPEYAEIHGRLVNALMGVKRQMGAMVDENLGALNMPTRKEVRTLQTRMQENRREIKALRAELAALKLQQEKAVVAPPVKSAPKRKTTPRKKTTTRKKTTVKK